MQFNCQCSRWLIILILERSLTKENGIHAPWETERSYGGSHGHKNLNSISGPFSLIFKILQHVLGGGGGGGGLWAYTLKNALAWNGQLIMKTGRIFLPKLGFFFFILFSSGENTFNTAWVWKSAEKEYAQCSVEVIDCNCKICMNGFKKKPFLSCELYYFFSRWVPILTSLLEKNKSSW